jgi:hypothetical protein
MFSKNDPNINRQGKKPGTQNEQTRKMKEAFGMLIEGNLDRMTVWLDTIAETDPKAAFDIIVRLSELFVPKLSQQALTDADGGDLFRNIQFRFGDEPKPTEDEEV